MTTVHTTNLAGIPITLSVEIAPSGFATLIAHHNGVQVFDLTLTTDEMRRVLYALHAHVEQHQENP